MLVGRESAGVPDAVHDAADARLLIPMRAGMRSLNVAQAAAMVLGEALRQTGAFPARCGGRLFHLTLFEPGGLVALAQVVMIDIVLAGDNAVVIGLAAARVPAHLRRKVILWGLTAAVVLRVGLALMAVSLLQMIGLTLAGGILLLWVSWRFWRDISGAHKAAHQAVDANASLQARHPADRDRGYFHVAGQCAGGVGRGDRASGCAGDRLAAVGGADGRGGGDDRPAAGTLALDFLSRAF